ncbi:hypothetical protein GCM10020366_07230 [Saccharopolyspora gregorii]|uniref:Uncharacterized protein n=1 Tax=Saccharopolyspora gregorii TaxID=33914 RepID=A0ABP6RJP9_9PSEU
MLAAAAGRQAARGAAARPRAERGAHLARLTPVTDLQPFATHKWLEQLWSPEGLPEQEKEVVAWQNENDNMGERSWS